MKQIFSPITCLVLFCLVFSTPALAGTKMPGHDMPDHDMAGSNRMGTLFHESMVDGHMLAYYLMDLRDHQQDVHKDHDMKKMNKDNTHDMEKMEMDKPHHIMVYIMDKDHAPALKGTIGFLIRDEAGNAQKAMAMYMSEGFGITADMKKKGVYTISVKALLGKTKLMDKFEFEIK